MPTPLVLADNYFDVVRYTGHTVSATEEASGHAADLVGNGRRSLEDYHTSTTANVDIAIQVAMDRVRAFNCIVIDRGMNYLGKTIDGRYWSGSSGNGSPSFFGGTILLPTHSYGGSVDDAYGVVTEEGAWIKRFPTVYAKNAGLNILAMGAGLKPQTVGIYLGLAWTPPTPDYPWEEETTETGGMDFETDGGWIGSSRTWNRRTGSLNVRLASALDYDQPRLHIQGFYAQRHPMWVCFDDQQADRTWCSQKPRGTMGFRFDREWLNKRRAEIPLVEHEPLNP